MGEIKHGYKKTEIGVIPEDWNVVRLGDLSDIKTGPFGAQLHESDYVQNGTPIITVEHLGDYGIEVKDGVPMVSDEHKEQLKQYILKADDIVFSRVGSIDRNALVTENETGWLFSGRLLRVRPTKRLVAKFLSNYFKGESFKTRIKAVAVGQTMPSLNTQILSDMLIICPQPDEQRAIADALSEIAVQITALDELIAKKRELKQGAMQKLLTGEERLEGFSGQWAETVLGNLADIKRGASPRPIADPKWFGGTVGWVRISDVTLSHIYLLETTDYLSDLGVEQSVQIFHGELIMSIAATVGLFAITKMEACIHDGFVVFKNLHEKVDVLFLYYYLTFFSKVFTDAGQTGSQKNVNADIVNRIKIQLPDHTEQQAIAIILSAMDSEITDLEDKREKVVNLKQGMMQELLTGRTRLV
jgi:type I restriction enzyme S subunit